ncbi:MAG TPA: TetR family transcriptional regulator [Allosphingosinicella sp.]|nr:TetR family transcriptional regulator [Allosphingosinicella sp.]
MKVSQQNIVVTALAVMHKEGLDKLSMRALAKQLGVQASALYWHIGGKEELLSCMSTTFFGRALDAMPENLSWREWLLAFGQTFRAALLSHRDSARLCAIARPVDNAAWEMNARLIEPLVSNGLDRHTALSYLSSVISLSLGGALSEQSGAFDDYLDQMVPFDEVHATALSSMVAGFPESVAREEQKQDPLCVGDVAPLLKKVP